MKTLKHWLYKRLFPHKLKIQTFTYYIPAPPSRKSGYREKEFDRLFYKFVNQGFEVLSINTQSNPGKDQSGLWVIVTVRSTDPNMAFKELDEQELEAEAPIEGMYYIDEN